VISNAIQPQAANTVVTAMVEACGVMYRECWGEVLGAVAKLFESLGSTPAMLQPLIEAVGLLHGAAKANAVDDAIGAAIEHCGPVAVMQVLPLNLFPPASTDPTQHQPRQWLLPLLKRRTTHGSLQLFVEHFLPAADRVGTMFEQARRINKLAETEQLRELHQQIWTALEGMCTFPIDTATVLPSLLEPINRALHAAHLRTVVASALERLANSYRDISADAPKEVAAGVKTLNQHAKTILPQLFNIYSSAQPQERPALSDAIRALAAVADTGVVSKFFDTCLKRLIQASMKDDGSQTVNERLVMTSLALALVDVLPLKSMAQLYRALQPQFSDADAAVQKQSYKVLKHLSAREGFFGEGAKPATVIKALADSLQVC